MASKDERKTLMSPPGAQAYLDGNCISIQRGCPLGCANYTPQSVCVGLSFRICALDHCLGDVDHEERDLSGR